MAVTYETYIENFNENIKDMLLERHACYRKLVTINYNIDYYCEETEAEGILPFYFKCPCNYYRNCTHHQEGPSPVVIPWCPLQTELKFFEITQPFEDQGIHIYYQCPTCIKEGTNPIFQYVCNRATPNMVIQQYNQFKDWIQETLSN